MSFKATCFGGLLHGQEQESKEPFFTYIVPQPLPDVSTFSGTEETTTIPPMHAYKLVDLSYRHESKLHPLNVWMPVEVKDPYAFMVELALTKGASHV